MNIQEILNTTHNIPVILAPMAGVTDLAYREICMANGCDFTYSEMISAKAVSFNNKKTFKLMSVSEKAKPYGIQLFGHEPQLMAEIAAYICDEYSDDLSLIDINMGCPAPKIVNNGDGCALMNDIKLASKIIEYVSKASKIPITVKFRKGWNSDNINAVEFAKMAEDSGAKAVTIHGRTREQMYSGNADWEIIAEIKSKLNIPVIGNGDIVDVISAQKMLEVTGCDAIMVGRAAQGNPFIFDEIRAGIENRTYERPSLETIIETALEHIRLHEMYKGPAAFAEMRKHIAWYTKGIKGSARLRTQIFSANTAGEAAIILKSIVT